MKHCWSCAKRNSCPNFAPKKKACKEHKYSEGIKSEEIVMTRKEEIVQASENYYNEVKYLSDLSAFPIAAFKAGAIWADRTMLDKVYDFIIANVYKCGKVKFVDNRAIFDFRMNTFLNDLKQAMEE